MLKFSLLQPAKLSAVVFALQSGSQPAQFERTEIVYVGDRAESRKIWTNLLALNEKGGVLRKAAELKLKIVEIDGGLVVIDHRLDTFVARRMRKLQLAEKYLASGQPKVLTWNELKDDLSADLSEYVGNVSEIADNTPIAVAPDVRWNFVNGERLEPGMPSVNLPQKIREEIRNKPATIRKATARTVSQVESSGWFFGNNEGRFVDPLRSQVIDRVAKKLVEIDRADEITSKQAESELLKRLVKAGKIGIGEDVLKARNFLELSPTEREKWLGGSEQVFEKLGFSSAKAMRDFYTSSSIQDLRFTMVISFGDKQPDGTVYTTTIRF